MALPPNLGALYALAESHTDCGIPTHAAVGPYSMYYHSNTSLPVQPRSLSIDFQSRSQPELENLPQSSNASATRNQAIVKGEFNGEASQTRPSSHHPDRLLKRNADLIGHSQQQPTKRKTRARHCEHGRRRSLCKECGGSSICHHNRRRAECKECGGTAICEHRRQRSQCKECGGGGICEHSRIRSRCKECGGGGICQHGRRRSQCKECRGNNICRHSQIHRKCTECAAVYIGRNTRTVDGSQEELSGVVTGFSDMGRYLVRYSNGHSEQITKDILKSMLVPLDTQVCAVCIALGVSSAGSARNIFRQYASLEQTV